MQLQEKYALLKETIKSYGSLAVAFSGGVDSTFLLKVAHDQLGDKVIGITARSSTYPEREYLEAQKFANNAGIKQITIVSEELDIDGFSDNPTNRCYYCKKELYTKIYEVAAEHGLEYVADGSNMDDLGDYRPGLQAVNELKVVSPLKVAGLTKDEIRTLSKDLDLPTWNKQAFACLASRFPYGHKITEEKLSMVDKAEQFLLDLGFRQVRVRHHENIARIEVSSEEMTRFFDIDLMKKIDTKFKEVGFTYVSLDLQGYRTGSMNETLNLEELGAE